MTAPLLEATGLVKRYDLGRAGLMGARRTLVAVDGVDLAVPAGGCVGIVGESGSGKSTLARMLMLLERPDAGRVTLDGADLTALSDDALRPLRRRFQMVFQDPFGSLDPRMRVADIVAEPLDVAEPDLPRAERTARVRAMLERTGLRAEALGRYPHEFSGGQRQRIALARALVTSPALVVADEPVSALDVSVQAQVLNLMMDLRAELGLAYVFISHNLAVVEHVADEVLVMLSGRIVERAPATALFERPRHPYTRALADALPRLDRPRARLTLASGRDGAPMTGCVFAGRCPRAADLCRATAPALTATPEGGAVACHFPLD